MASEGWGQGVSSCSTIAVGSAHPKFDSRYRARHRFDRVPVPSPNVVQHVVQQVVQHVRVWSARHEHVVQHVAQHVVQHVCIVEFGH